MKDLEQWGLLTRSVLLCFGFVLSGILVIWRSERKEAPLDGRIHTLAMEVCATLQSRAAVSFLIIFAALGFSLTCLGFMAVRWAAMLLAGSTRVYCVTRTYGFEE